MQYSTFHLAAVLAMGLLPVAVQAQALPVSPATQPAAPSAVMSVETRILVLAFAPAQASDPDWISRAMQQSVLADLSRPTTGRPLQAISDSAAVNSTNDAIEAGKKANAKYVVVGNYQLVEPSLKVTGQIIDVESGKVVGGLKSTGSVRDLFDMQDRIAGQVRFAIANDRLAGKTSPQPAIAAKPEAPPVIEPLGPVVAVQRPYDNSDLSRAVADDVSLIDRYDAAGQSYRQQYYDDSYNGGYPIYYGSYPNYGGYGYGTYYNFNFGFNRSYRPSPCRPYRDSSHGRHRDDRSEVTPDPNDLTHQNDITCSSPFSSADAVAAPREGVVAHLNGPIPMTMQGTANNNYVKNAPNYVTPQYRNYVTPQSGNYVTPLNGNYVTPQYRNYNAAPSRNYVQAPPNTMQNVPANTANGPSSVAKPPRQLTGTAK